MTIAASLLIVAALLSIWARRGSTSAVPPLHDPRFSPVSISLDGVPLTGQTGAPVVMTIFSDFECPFSARFARRTWPELQARFVETGLLRVGFRHLPLRAIHPRAFHAAVLGECAHRQDRFWEFHDAVFREAPPLNSDFLGKLLRPERSRLDGAGVEDCIQREGPQRVKGDMTLAEHLGIHSTPTVLLGSHVSSTEFVASRRITGARPIEDFIAVIEEALKAPKGGS
jgi:protein-disulfide isomerase